MLHLHLQTTQQPNKMNRIDSNRTAGKKQMQWKVKYAIIIECLAYVIYKVSVCLTY